MSNQPFRPGQLIRLSAAVAVNETEEQCVYLVLAAKPYVDLISGGHGVHFGMEYKILYPIGEVGLMRITSGCEKNFVAVL